MEFTPKCSDAQSLLSVIRDRQIWPYQITSKLSASEITVEKLAYAVEVEATRRTINPLLLALVSILAMPDVRGRP